MTAKQTQMFSLNIPESSKPRVVVIGGGFGGINLIKKISNDFQIVLFDRYNYHTFQPLLYQVATAGLEPDSVAGPLRKIINKKKEIYFRMLMVTAINPDEKYIETSVGKLNFDYLVIATGAKMNFFGNQDIAKHAFPLKQVTHALDLRSHIFQQFEKLEILKDRNQNQYHMSFVVVGAGPTGVEVCGALAELKNHILPKDFPELEIEKVNIYLVEGLDRVLPGMSEKSGKKAHRYLEKMGVKVILNSLTKSFDGKTVKLNNGTTIKADTLIWAAGVKGNMIDGFPDQSIHKGKLIVNPVGQVQKNNNDAYKNIFAIGDIAHMQTNEYPEGLPGLAPVAIQQGRQLAKTIWRIHNGEKAKPFKYTNKGVLATVGRNKAVADLPANIKLGGFIGWVIWMTVHVLYLVGFRSKLIALTNWVWNYFTYDRGIRLILRPSTKEKDAISQNMQKQMSEIEH